MLRLDPFQLKMPSHLDEALELLADPGRKARILAGGTDLLPNLKHRIYGEVPLLVSLRRIEALRGIQITDSMLTIGAGTTLADFSRNELVRRHYPALAGAAANVASPQIRNMATLGGNLCLDTRCTFINQSEFWRDALGGCLKANGSVCHVVPGGRNCVAALSGDTAIALAALEATVELQGLSGTRSIPVLELYRADGAAHLTLAPGEILTRVHVPLRANRRLAYRKWSVRRSIDFPLVNVALRLDKNPDGTIAELVAVVGVLAARPKVITRLSQELSGHALNAGMTETIAEAIFRQCRPVPNVPYDPAYRREMLRVQAKRAVMNLLTGELQHVRA